MSNKCTYYFFQCIFFQIPINFDKKKMHLVPVNDLLSGWDCLSVTSSGVAQIRVQTVPWAVFSAPLRLQPNISGWLYEPFTYCSTVHCNWGQHENHKHSQTPSGKLFPFPYYISLVSCCGFTLRFFFKFVSRANCSNSYPPTKWPRKQKM